MNTYVVMTALFAGKAAQIAALALVTIALGAFGTVAMRLRKGVVNTLDEATESVVNKFVIPSDSSSSSVTSKSGDTSNTYNNAMRNVQTAANTVTSGAVAGKQLSGLLGGTGAAGADGQNGSTMGKIFGTGSGQEHASVASGSGDTTVNQNNAGAEVNSKKSALSSALFQNSNASNTNSDSYDNGMSNTSKSVDSNTDNLSNVASDARTTTNGVATGGEYVTDGYMRDQSSRDVKERSEGKDLMQYDSLASASGTKSVQADGAAAHASVNATGSSDVKSVKADAVGKAGVAGAAGVGANASVDANVSANATGDVKGVAAVNGVNGASGYGQAGQSGQGGAAGKAGLGGAAGHGANAGATANVNANAEAQKVRSVQASADSARVQAGQAGQGGAGGAAGLNGAAARGGAMNMNVASGEGQSRNVKVNSSASAHQGAGGAGGVGMTGANGAGSAGQFGRPGQSGTGAMTVRDRAARAQGGMPPGMYTMPGAAGQAGQSGQGGAAGMSARAGVGGAGGNGMYRQTRAGSGSGAGTSYIPGGNRYGNQGRMNRQDRRGRGDGSDLNPVIGKPYDPSVENGSRGVNPTGNIGPSGGAAGHYQPRTNSNSGGTYRNRT